MVFLALGLQVGQQLLVFMSMIAVRRCLGQFARAYLVRVSVLLITDVRHHPDTVCIVVVVVVVVVGSIDDGIESTVT